jgi:hypothetical protein
MEMRTIVTLEVSQLEEEEGTCFFFVNLIVRNGVMNSFTLIQMKDVWTFFKK